MAKPDLWSCVKFKRLCRDLNLPRPYIVGLLETLWQAAYATADPFVGPSEDVECAAEWPGGKGQLTSALVAARFLDQREDGYYIHDLTDHAPDYVKKRVQRRIDKGLYSKTADNDGQRQTLADNGESPNKNGALPTQYTHLQTPGEPTADAINSSPLSEDDIRRVLKAYPLQQGIKGAHYAAQQALLEIRRRGEPDPVSFLCAKIAMYAASDVVKKGKVYAPRKFFEEGHYDDDPETWRDKKPPPEDDNPYKPPGGWNETPLTPEEREYYKADPNAQHPTRKSKVQPK